MEAVLNAVHRASYWIREAKLNQNWQAIERLLVVLERSELDGDAELAADMRRYLYQHEGITSSIFIAPFLERYTTYLREQSSAARSNNRTRIRK